MFLTIGAADRSAELVLLQQRLGQARGRVEIVRRIDLVAAQVLEPGAVDAVAARFGDDADLSAAAGAVLGGIGARLDAELLDVLEARLQLERRRDLAVQVARRGVDDRRAFDAVVADRVLLDRASAEPDVLPRAGAGVLRSRRLQHQLRHLPPVHGQPLHFTWADVDAEARGAQVEDRRRAGHRHRFLHAGRLQLEVERQLLANRERHRGVLNRREAVLHHPDGVARRLQRSDEEVSRVVRHGCALVARALVLHRDLRGGHEGARLVPRRAGDFSLIRLRERRGRHRSKQERQGRRQIKLHHPSHGPAPAGHYVKGAYKQDVSATRRGCYRDVNKWLMMAISHHTRVPGWMTPSFGTMITPSRM